MSRRYVDYCPLDSDCNVQIDYKIWKCVDGRRTVCTHGKKKLSFIDKR